MGITFNDGESFDTTGELRIEKRSDGWYVIGKGMLIPVDSPEEGEQIIQQMTKGG